MLNYRMFRVNTLLIIFSLSFLSPQLVLAKTPKAIITSSGKAIPFKDTRIRVHKLLRSLGEPTWTKKELTRLTRSVHSYLRAFSGRQFDATLAALRRGDRYRPMLRAKLARAKIPLAFEALPMAESAYRFNARSKAGARGLWQYMPASARQYGLHVSRKLDQRTDPAMATDAALDYLKYLNRKFGKVSILLSVAAYNAGEGRIGRVVRRSGIKSGKRGYSRVLRFLPKETRGYVPEFLAAAILVKSPAYYGFPTTTQRTHQYVQVRKPLTVQKIANISKMSLANVQQLNPELKKYKRTPTNNYFIRLPNKAAVRLKNQLADQAKLWKPVSSPITLEHVTQQAHAAKAKKANKKFGSHTVYTVNKGNNLGGIADIFSVPIKDIRQINNVRGNRIHVGQALIIPTKKNLDRKVYRVRSGDNLGSIAQRLGIGVSHLKFVNGVTNPRRLRLGQKLIYYI